MALDRFLFRLMYGAGKTQWDEHSLPERLRARVEGPDPLRAERALVLGCGSGSTCSYLARHGWETIGVDYGNKTIEKARAKTEAAHLKVRYVEGDFLRLGHHMIGDHFQLISDNGCFHGLTSGRRDDYVQKISAMVPTGGYLFLAGLMAGTQPGVRGFLPYEVENRFAPDWKVLSEGPDTGVSMNPSAVVHVYELRKWT